MTSTDRDARVSEVLGDVTDTVRVALATGIAPREIRQHIAAAGLPTIVSPNGDIPDLAAVQALHQIRGLVEARRMSPGLLDAIALIIHRWETAPAPAVVGDPLARLLAHLVADGEGPWLMIRPYDTGNFGVHAYRPSDQHDGDDEIAYGKGPQVDLAAEVVYARLSGVPVCAWCHAISSDPAAPPVGWLQHEPSGAWTCTACAPELLTEEPDRAA